MRCVKCLINNGLMTGYLTDFQKKKRVIEQFK